MERLDKLLAATGRWSRREAKALVREGRVLVDGVPALRAEDKVDPDRSTVLVDGGDIGYARHVYVMLHKPAGVLSATEDPRQETVLDLLPPELKKRGLFPVGRLDKDTEGLLLLTDDGDLAHRLLSPKKHVDKVYQARLDRPLGEADRDAFARGILLEDGYRCMAAELELLGDGTEVRIVLREGKFHQVKRMTAARGSQVLSLKRLRMGPLVLDEALAPGQWRRLTPAEVQALGEER
ncbi:MAG: rRNA pseudouridine synthase [Oscillospiraceae bacterium]|nr:rRNA pseudouridine synthase [Oscillospiraceae bacterium]MCI8878336.1 rRNA pseudouridine synthase [Oscillospiraceae bacterium]